MSVSSASDDVRMVSTKSAVSASRSFCSSRLVMPTIAFMGVRISWLMLARKSFLARLAASAATTISFSLVMSIDAPISRDGLPSANCTCAVLRRHWITPGSGTMRNSTEYGSPVVNARSEPLAKSHRSSGWTISRTSSTWRPTLASATRSSAAHASEPLTMPVARSISQIPKAAAISASRIRSADRLRRSTTSFSAVTSMIAPTIGAECPGRRDVSVVAIPADGSVGKHPPKFVDVGRPAPAARSRASAAAARSSGCTLA